MRRGRNKVGTAVVASWLKNTAPTTAMPSAPPICWTALAMPDAEPASSGSTLVRMNGSRGTMTRPIPAPMTNKAGARCQVDRSGPELSAIRATAAVAEGRDGDADGEGPAAHSGDGFLA